MTFPVTAGVSFPLSCGMYQNVPFTTALETMASHLKPRVSGRVHVVAVTPTATWTLALGGYEH